MNVTAKPFLKWAGGKRQLLAQIVASLPDELAQGGIDRYIEPFLGGGAVFLHIAQNHSIPESYLADRNEELALAYQSVRQRVEEVIAALDSMERAYAGMSPTQQKSYFYAVRAQFNAERSQTDFSCPSPHSVKRTAQLIFLNRTCFNGLFRVNAKGEFNVPFGAYTNPLLCDADNLRALSAVLRKTCILHGDFTLCEPYVDARTFVYFDPPYRPISRSASFNSYSRQPFDDGAQARLAEFYRVLDGKGAKLMLSNSDPHNENLADDFFEQLFSGFHIRKVFAKRNINSNGARRGAITELLITNY
ncbi:MAG: DNA adenine methylase [Chloroflexi bacterium]|nr:DNA adenine methylase [Chloroflexota bacterium]